MKRSNKKFSEYPFRVPNEAKLVAKLQGFIEQIKACQDAKSAAKVINAYNKYG